MYTMTYSSLLEDVRRYLERGFTAESDQIVEALKERGIDVPYIVKDNEGHGFANEENRLYFYRAVERFLAKHLGGRAEESDEKIPELDGDKL